MIKQTTAVLIKTLLAVCLCLMLTHQAEAGTIEWSGEQNIVIPWYVPGDTFIDIDSNGISDFMIRNQGSLNYLAYSLVDGNEFFCTTDEEPDKYPPASRPEPSGTIIGDTPVEPHVWYDNPDHGQILLSFGNGYWDGADHKYMGVRFYGDAALYYGWIEMSIEPDMPQDMTIHSWAYNTQPGVGLVAGVVPEPSTWALFLCGGIALLVRMWQRRKSI